MSSSPIDIRRPTELAPPSTITRRLSTRRGSVSASDPYGTHVHLNSSPSSATLTIVKLNPQNISPSPTNLTLQDPPSSPVLHSRRLSRRHGSTSSLDTTGSANGSNGLSNPRLSFAFTTFSGPGPAQPPSPHTSPRLRPASPSTSRARPASPSDARSLARARNPPPKLSPDQLFDLARQAANPRFPPASPSWGSGSSPNSPLAEASPVLERASFTPMAADVYLPFVDRPVEVSLLISSPPSAKLFSLLAQTFPRTTSNSSADASPPPALAEFADTDSVTWTFSQLQTWLTAVDRDAAPDAPWVLRARRCVRAHSELIWERIKGALGVPPELDVDVDIDAEGSVHDDIEEPNAESNVDEDGATGEQPLDGDATIVSSPISTHPNPNGLGLSIEPILSPSSTPASQHPPPLSLPASLSEPACTDGALQDIGEEEEEEGEGDTPTNGNGKSPESNPNSKNQELEEEKREIHGLRICTSPQIPRSHSFSSTRSLSSNSLPPPSPSLTRTGTAPPSPWEEPDVGGYHPIGERGPGNPLFPSSFARLAVAPTLSANNPLLRGAPPPPPPPAYGANPHAIRLGRPQSTSPATGYAPLPGTAGGRGGRPGYRRLPSWAEGWDPVKQEYALTIASSSSVGGPE